MRKLLITIVVLVGVLVAADRIALLVAEHQISNKLATAYNLSPAPGVSIHGFPFLTEVVSGQYQQVDVKVASLTSQTVPLQNLDAQFTSVDAPLKQVLGSGGQAQITANQATGTATVPFSVINQRLPNGVTVSPDGSNLKMSGTTSYLGQQVPFTATATVGVAGNGISISPHDVTVAGQSGIPASALGPLSVAVPVGNLPMHLSLNAVQPTASGLQVSVSAQNVQFEGGTSAAG